MKEIGNKKRNSIKRRKMTVIRLAIAGVALAGVGSALTTAAWTDQAWFTANASSAKIELYGALADDQGKCPDVDSAAYQAADTNNGAVAIGLAPFENLVPDETRSAGICLHNGSTVPLKVSAVVDTQGNEVFDGLGGAALELKDGDARFATQELQGGDVKQVKVVATTPDTWDASYQGKNSGVIPITFTGSTDLN